MPRFAQLVIGPAGCGKSTYCSQMEQHCQAVHHPCKIVNLDPAAEHFDYEPTADIRDLIQLDDVMSDEELQLGPNGGLVFCLSFLMQNIDWLDKELGEDECDYVLFDCPGQIELYSHLPIMPRLVQHFERKWDFRFVTVFVLDARFLVDSTHFVAGLLTAMSSMLVIGTAHVNIMTKMDMLTERQRKLVVARYLEPDLRFILQEDHHQPHASRKMDRIVHGLARLIDQYSMIQFLPFNRDDEETVESVLLQVDLCLQFHDYVEPSNRAFDQAEEELVADDTEDNRNYG